jgi:general secretion pathway protein D
MSLTKVVFAVALTTFATLPLRADKFKTTFEQGLRAEQTGDLDSAFLLVQQTYQHNPSNTQYAAAFTRIRFKASQTHVHEGEKLLAEGALPAALTHFQTAVSIDQSSTIARQELKRTVDMLQEQEKSKTPAHVPVPKEFGTALELKPLSSSPISIYLTTTTDTAYKTIGKLAGLNVVLDPEYKPQKVNVDLTNVTLKDALDILAMETKTFWRPLLPNTIFVAADNVTKRKELEQNVMKTFYLRNIEAVSDLQDAANVVKQMLDVPRVQLLQSQDAIIVRGTPDQLKLAEKILSELDHPKSEVIIDVAVMEVSRDKMRKLGNTVPTSFDIGYVGSSGGTGGGGSGTNNSLVLNALKTLSGNSFAVAIPGASLNLLSTDSRTKVLQQPQVRALNDQKATLRIGDRVPIATGSYQSGVVGGASISPLIGTQFTYLDVGVNIDITPHVHSNGDVTLKMSLEISSVTGEQTIGGITEPTIGQRRIEQETRLADGEVNLLGGILQDTETQSLSGYPLLSRIPVLKYLFAQDNKEHSQEEIIFAITPHIVRSQEITAAGTPAIEVGTGTTTQLRSTSESSSRNVSPPAVQGESKPKP